MKLERTGKDSLKHGFLILGLSSPPHRVLPAVFSCAPTGVEEGGLWALLHFGSLITFMRRESDKNTDSASWRRRRRKMRSML